MNKLASLLMVQIVLSLQVNAFIEPHTILEKYKDREAKFMIFFKRSFAYLDEALQPYLQGENNGVIIDSAYSTFRRRVMIATRILLEELTQFYTDYNFEEWPLPVDLDDQYEKYFNF